MEQVQGSRPGAGRGTAPRSTVSVRREAPSQRRYFRLTAPIWINVKGKSYRTANWSRGGFSLADFAEPVGAGTHIAVRAFISFQGYEISFVTKVKVVWVETPERVAAFEFVGLNEKQNELLEFFANGLISGEMTSFQDAIKRIDIPVTPIAEHPDLDTGEEHPRTTYKRLAIGASYLVVGLAVGTYVATSIYSTLFEINVESAVVSAPVEILRAPASGTLESIYIALDQDVPANTPILGIHDAATSEEIELAKISLAIEKSALQQKENALLTVRDIGTSRIEIAKSKINTLKEQLAFAEKNAKRIARLRKSGVVSDVDREQADNKVTVLRADLAAAKADLLIANRGVGNTNDGRMYAALEIKGDVPELEMAVHYARQRVAYEEEKFKVLKARLAQSQIVAPFEGRVTRFYVSAGAAVEKGQPLAIVEHAHQRHVDAFLTQAEIDRMSITAPARATIPSMDRDIHVKVARIDRTSGLVDDQFAQLRWSDNNARTAHVVLEFDGGAKELGERPIPTGLPVVVTLRKNPLINWLPR